MSLYITKEDKNSFGRFSDRKNNYDDDMEISKFIVFAKPFYGESFEFIIKPLMIRKFFFPILFIFGKKTNYFVIFKFSNKMNILPTIRVELMIFGLQDQCVTTAPS